MCLTIFLAKLKGRPTSSSGVIWAGDEFIVEVYLLTLCKRAGNMAAAAAGSRCTNVASVMMQRPNSSSLYCSTAVPHSAPVVIVCFKLGPQTIPTTV